MEFGIFNSLYLPKRLSDRDPIGAEHSRLMDEVAWTQAADRAGFKYTWATEHHFLDEYSHLSANEVFLAYVAGTTTNIHIGSGIFNITPPVNHPARIAERAAMLDHLSGGRFELGMGRGSSSTEQKGFGIEDPALTKLMFDEVVAELPKMWKDEPYAHDGQFFTMPERNVLPKPYTRPHPPLWVAAGNPGTFEKAAKMGLGVLCFANSSPEELAPLIETYKKNIEKAEPIGGYINNNIMVTSQMLCLEDGDRARQIATDITMSYQHSQVYRYLDTFPKPNWVPDWPATLPEPTVEILQLGVQAGTICIGDPGEVERAVQSYVNIGADQLVFGMLSTTMPIEVAVEAVDTFGRHVLPKFDKDPVHSTTRQREAQLSRKA
ncbi:LLM class flavin-dependent oxidoreductase [Frankia sp. AgB1.9]|uniref:LLM class flavin-dependent oxidoreductase n=1 Tax=unclassified Frankia TaxID=2632575 RepID=UPI001933DC6E|nr:MULTISPECIES: LLM class flavin-dependent oxidoreductase [unclassified Frankia]MBL7493398.1 LLM class flavin-dependent oxidoreductase [Frankia sp. AgW1.1]MBL7549712.1 LLM class flavin-dependent oxidoreductase [Frankia sp. AgB1.9]MBL7620925.1 LLM class flavin-dependent oxidoreductase [Frankia sp. AgB1.8]